MINLKIPKHITHNSQRLLLFLLIILNSQLTTLNAFTSLGALNLGDELRGLSARSLAMGGTGIASGKDSTALFVNPALLSSPSHESSPLRGEGGGEGDRLAMEISVSPGFTTIFSRRTHQDRSFAAATKAHFNLQSFSVSLQHPKISFLTLAGGWNASSNFDFSFDEKSTRDRKDQENSGKAAGRDVISRHGLLSYWSMGGAIKPAKWISIGGSYLRWGGDLKSETQLFTDRAGQSQIKQEFNLSKSYKGNSYLVGFSLKFLPYFVVGANYYSQFDLGVSSRSSFSQSDITVSTGSLEFDFRMPDRYGLGISYFIGGSEKNIVTADFIYTRWKSSRFKVTSIDGVPVNFHGDLKYNDTIEFHIGYEYLIKDKFPLRLGFYYLPDYSGVPQSATPFFTAGTGYVWGNFVLDIAGEFGRREIKQDDLFFSGRDTVTDTRFRFLMTLTYRWNK